MTHLDMDYGFEGCEDMVFELDRKVPWEQIANDTVWVAKMCGWRAVGTRAEIGHLFDEEDCRDFDLCAEQPKHLRPFYYEYFDYSDKHGWITLQEFYRNVYAA